MLTILNVVCFVFILMAMISVCSVFCVFWMTSGVVSVNGMSLWTSVVSPLALGCFEFEVDV